ncbi:MAG: sugar phosphate isomerase/epimerase [Clostridia bacterium]|nr:sugar phosphate isomerase/epimerase [Clostridia bacterium]
MAEIGVSSACYYPLETEKSLIKLAEIGVRCAELFLNSPSETEPAFTDMLRRIKDKAGMRIVSVHPYMSFAESFFLFSSYERRYRDILPLYEHLFETTAELGADYFVFHGAKIPGSIEDDLYFERFAELTRLGKKYGVQVCQENVVHYRSEDPAYISRMAAGVGEDFGFVLDIKQARRAGFDWHDFTNTLTPYIRHVHISDYTQQKDCVTPGDGEFDFAGFFNEMKSSGYDGTYIIELYRHSYKSEEDIEKAYQSLKKILP